MTTTIERTKITPPAIAAAWGISLDKVLAYIRAGELRAINAATPGANVRPRYLVDLEDLKKFEESRVVQPSPTKPVLRSRKKKSQAGDRY